MSQKFISLAKAIKRREGNPRCVHLAYEVWEFSGGSSETEFTLYVEGKCNIHRPTLKQAIKSYMGGSTS